MRTRPRHLVSAMAIAMGAFAAMPALDGAPAAAELGAAIPGLTAEETARFEAGREAFAETEVAADGLGPVFNGDSCAACHSDPAVGGGGTRVETRFGRRRRGAFDPLDALGGSLLQDQGIGRAGACDFGAEVVPPEANVTAGRRTTPLFGLGLVDAVPDDALTALAALERVRRPQTAGRPHLVQDAVSGKTRVGRFGWKSQVASLLHFSADAYLNEMGVTTPIFPNENCPNGDCALLACDPVADPEDEGEDMVAFADFMALLAPPSPRLASFGRERARGGRDVFDRIGCADCHLPTLRSGPSEIAALANREFAPYSDFLLHDMGSLGDGIDQGDAKGREMRTAPLWGLHAISRFLHDGRAATVEDAILAHDGQARTSRDRYRTLGREERTRLLDFLKSL